MYLIVYFSIHLLVIYCLSFYTNTSKVDIIVASAIIFTAILGDSLLRTYAQDIVRGLVDSSTHGLIGLFSWCIVVLHVKRSFNSKLYEILICGFLSSVIDIDHFIKAKSFHIKDALYQNERPYLHCSTIPVVILIVNIIVSTWFKSFKLARFGWILWTSFTSHHIRDANRRGLWFYPFGSTQPLPDIGYILSMIVLPYVTVFLMNHLQEFSPLSDNRNFTIDSRSYFEVI